MAYAELDGGGGMAMDGHDVMRHIVRCLQICNVDSTLNRDEGWVWVASGFSCCTALFELSEGMHWVLEGGSSNLESCSNFYKPCDVSNALCVVDASVAIIQVESDLGRARPSARPS